MSFFIPIINLIEYLRLNSYFQLVDLYLKYINQENLSNIWTFFLYVLLFFVILIHFFPRLTTKLCSNPYPQQWSWQFGTKSFDLQLLNVIVYHQGRDAWWTHWPTLLIDISLWSIVIFHHFHSLGLILLLTLWIFQLLSFNDLSFAFLSFLILNFLASIGLLAYGYHSIYTYNLARILIIGNGLIRTIGHSTEKLPPFLLSLDKKSRKFSHTNMKTYFKSGRALATVVIGIAQETLAGIPGRLAPYIIYVLLYEDYVPKHHQSLADILESTRKIIEGGWQEDTIMKNLFSWAFHKVNLASPRTKQRTEKWIRFFWFEFCLLSIFLLVLLMRPSIIGTNHSPTMIICLIACAYAYYRQLWRRDIVAFCYQQEAMVICHLMLICWFGLNSDSGKIEDRFVMVVGNIIIGLVRLSFLEYYVSDGLYDP